MGNKEICNIISFTFIVSPGILSIIPFFRMYIMAMFFTTFLIFTIIKEIDISKNKFNFYLKLYFISVFGILILYYCIFLYFFIFFILLLKRKWKSIINIIVIGMLVGITVIIIFPPIIKHIFYGYRGKQSFMNLKQSKEKYWLNILTFFQFINKDLFENKLIVIIFCILILIFIILFFERKRKKLEISPDFNQFQYNNKKHIKNAIKKYSVILISILMYFLFISKIAAYNQVRFMIPIYCIIFIEFYSLLFLLIFKVIQNKYYF